jgi:AraC-like DNA-binding protein
MNKGKAKINIAARKSGSLFFEEYSFSAGRFEPFEAHSHPEYQIGLSVDTCGKYIYRGNRLTVPRMALSVIHSGAAHKPNKELYLETPHRYRMLYVSPEEMLETAHAAGWRKSDELPFFSEFVIDDGFLLQKYQELFRLDDDRLADDVRQTDFLTALVGHFSQIKNSVKKLKSVQPAIKKAREYLDANFTNQISLDELARIADLSKYHLCRTFYESVGVSPHVYQSHLRLNLAKKLLVQQRPIADVAYELGFYDQSHFGKYFKSFLGVTPHNYSQTAIFS